MQPKLASTILTGLLYAQAMLGFAGLTTVLLKDWSKTEPAIVVGVDNTTTTAIR